MKVVMVGEGAFANKHLDAIERIEGVEVISLCGGVREAVDEVAQSRGIGHATLDLEEALGQPGVEAAILATPTPLHAEQALAVMRAGKHVMIEIPMADNLRDSDELVRVQASTGVVAMVDHVRRFNPSHQWIHGKIRAGDLNIQQMDVQTYFFTGRIPTRWVNRAVGRIICSGTTPATLLTCSSTRRVALPLRSAE